MRLLITFISFTAAMLLGGLVLFINQIPKEPYVLKGHMDAIVVLTGGSKRIEHGIKMLEDGLADKMFISGVGVDVEVKDIIADINPVISQKITLGLRASDTASNAIEAKEWIKQHQVEAFYLVTSNYHIPRALLEFTRKLPHTQIIAAPVIPDTVKVRYWWLYPGTLKLLASEYIKVLAIHTGITTGSYGKLS